VPQEYWTLLGQDPTKNRLYVNHSKMWVPILIKLISKTSDCSKVKFSITYLNNFLSSVMGLTAFSMSKVT